MEYSASAMRLEEASLSRMLVVLILEIDILFSSGVQMRVTTWFFSNVTL